MHERIRVLVVDDDPEVRSLLGRVLTKNSWTTTEASSGADAMATLGRQEFDVVLLDVKLPDASGLDILRWARESDVDTEFVILTGNADVETAVEAMRLGAYDFVAKPWRNAELVQVIGKAAEKKDLRRENYALKEVMTRRDGMPNIVGDSGEIVEVVSMVGRVAASGAALPDTLLETELFGHKRGAFSGAVNSRVGLFEAADGGTLFLDEIGEMSPAMQVRLLRVLDSGEVRRVGEERAFNVDTRIVAATNKDLNREASEGRFRWDLFYRVATIVIQVPALRRRRDDIPLLVQHFATQGARGGKPLRFSPEAMERLQRYEWPGNIRELRNLIERLHILQEGDEVQASSLPPELTVVNRAAAEPVQTTLVSLQDMERQYVDRVLQSTGWNKAQAARVLEVDIKTLNKKIRDFNIVRPA